MNNLRVKILQQKRKGWKTRAAFLILLWILLFATSMYLLKSLLATFVSNPQGNAVVSNTWAGYVVTPDSGNPEDQVVGINASWTVPRVRIVSTDTFSATWIGIGGHSDKTLIQTGTEQDVVNGQEYYSAWYELVPDVAIRITDMSVSAGDEIIASISLVNSDTNEWAINIYDATNEKGFYQTFVYNSSRLSAEWIVERPTVNAGISLLANFGNVTFTDSYVKIGNNVGKFGNFSYSKIEMTNTASSQLASVSPINADSSSFTVYYLASR
jgi:hypothetical protein